MKSKVQHRRHHVKKYTVRSTYPCKHIANRSELQEGVGNRDFKTDYVSELSEDNQEEKGSAVAYQDQVALVVRNIVIII